MNESEKFDHEGLLTTCYHLNKERSYVTGFSSKTYEINRISNIVFLGVLTVSTILLNAFAIITIQKNPKLKNKFCYFVIFIQSFVDLGVGCIVIPAVTVFSLQPFINVDVCISVLVARSTTILFIGLSIVTLSALTLERYLGVLHPSFHRSRLTKKGIVIYVVGATLVLLLSFTASNIIHDEISKYTSILILATFLIFVVFAYTRIYLVIRKITRVSVHDEAKQGDRRRLFRETKHALACFIVVAFFIVLMIPYMLYPIFEQFGRMASNAYSLWSVSLLLSISSVNSAIFFWKNTVLRNEAKKVVKNMF
jgi:hypothetical protein